MGASFWTSFPPGSAARQSSAPIGISIPEGLLADTTLPLEVEILLTLGNSCGVVEMPLRRKRKTPELKSIKLHRFSTRNSNRGNGKHP